MINYLEGIVKQADEKSLLVLVNGVGFHVISPETPKFTPGKKAELFTYLHWSADNGPSMYGFTSEQMRTLFLLIIDCPKIGPSVAMAVLSAITPAQFIEAITGQKEAILSDINGIGTKKAEQIITHLKHKVPKMLLKGGITIHAGDQMVNQWHEVSEALASLNYSRQEITGALQYLTEKYAGQPSTLDQLIRAGLGYLSKAKAHL